MIRGLLKSIAALIVVPATLFAGEAKQVNIIAAAHDSPLEGSIGPIQLKDQGGVVIRDARALVAMSVESASAKDPEVQKTMEADLAKLLDVSAIDWSKQMVLAVRGVSGTKLDKVHIESIKIEGKVLTVSYKVKQRPPHAGPGSPVSAILVERFDGEVKFVETK